MSFLSELVESKGYKNAMKYVYGWGAAVVLLGALFKIQHYPGAGPMLVIGMGTEILIFFLSAFEPLHEEVDWTLVYPELAGMTDVEDGHDRGGYVKADSRLVNIANMPAPQSFLPQDNQGAQQPAQQMQGGGGFIAGGPSISADFSGLKSLENFDKLIAEANLTPEMFQHIGEGFHKMGDVANQFQELEGSINAAGNFASNIESASRAAEGLSNACANGSETLRESVGSLSQSYIRSSELMNQTGETVASSIQDGIKTMVGALGEAGSNLISSMSNSEKEMANIYATMTNQINATVEAVKNSSGDFQSNLEAQNKNLSSINAVYELHLQNVNQQVKMSQELQQKGTEMLEGFNEGLRQTLVYKDELAKLNTQLGQLNQVYGSMLSTVTINE